jgi:hypothetical protein
MNEMTEARLLEIIAGHGSRPDRWPREERAAALALLDASPAAREALADATRLDVMLDRHPVPPVSLALQSRIAAIPERRHETLAGVFRSFWPFGALWRPAGGLAAAAIIGLMVGIGTPQDEGTQITQVPEAFAAVIAAAGGEVEETLQ